MEHETRNIERGTRNLSNFKPFKRTTNQPPDSYRDNQSTIPLPYTSCQSP